MAAGGLLTSGLGTRQLTVLQLYSLTSMIDGARDKVLFDLFC
jgi:hypothetical protein